MLVRWLRPSGRYGLPYIHRELMTLTQLASVTHRLRNFNMTSHLKFVGNCDADDVYNQR